MRRYALMILIVGCGGEPMTAQPDGDAPGLDAGTDAGVVLCARDGDCDDDLFCTGQERCRPGEEGADARGCVVIPAPCESEMCDEAADECSVCSMPDADIDGYDSVACGGGDCDDTRGDVHPGTPEVCDALGVDEDCNPTTLGTDADGDGAYDPACCHQPADGALTCGLDCDDTDDAIGPDAPERCNGVDDDCDEIIDEGFDCIQSQTVSGTNACGREGTRRCSETCEWLDASFTRAESASSCDYCDDSGAGLGEEIPFAGEMLDSEFVETLVIHGDASFVHGPVGTPTQTFVTSGGNSHGGVYTPAPLRLGYGPTRVEARVTTYANRTSTNQVLSPIAGGWALVVLPGMPSSYVGSGFAGLPDEAGIAVRWSFTSNVDGCLACSRAPDGVELVELVPGATPRLLGAFRDLDSDQDGPMGSSVSQFLWIEITPDDPRTASDETEFGVISPIGIDLRCVNAGPNPCGIVFRPGMELHVGITASSNSGNDVTVGHPEIASTQYGLCSP